MVKSVSSSKIQRINFGFLIEITILPFLRKLDFLGSYILIKVYDEKGVSTEKGVSFTVNLQLFIPNFFWIFDCWHFGFPNVDLTALITSLNEYFVAYSNMSSHFLLFVCRMQGEKSGYLSGKEAFVEGTRRG